MDHDVFVRPLPLDLEEAEASSWAGGSSTHVGLPRARSKAALRDRGLKCVGPRACDRPRRQFQRHEFEGLPFSDASAFGILPDIPRRADRPLGAIRSVFATPEDINDSTQTAPGKRTVRAVPRFRKRVHGPLIAEWTGMERIRAECRRFNAWLECLATCRIASGRSRTRPSVVNRMGLRARMFGRRQLRRPMLTNLQCLKTARGRLSLKRKGPAAHGNPAPRFNCACLSQGTGNESCILASSFAGLKVRCRPGSPRRCHDRDWSPDALPEQENRGGSVLGRTFRQA